MSDQDHGEIVTDICSYADGGQPTLLDIIDVPVICATPKTYQQENWLISPTRTWEKVGELQWNHICALSGQASPLWVNGSSTYGGANDEIPLQKAQELTSSLRLIRVDQLVITVCAPGAAFGNNKRRVRGRFTYGNAEYRLWVTDPLYEKMYLAKPDNEYHIGESMLTISISEPFEQKNACYKLIAAIIERPRSDNL